jgi:hypothetical protein
MRRKTIAVIAFDGMSPFHDRALPRLARIGARSACPAARC